MSKKICKKFFIFYLFFTFYVLKVILGEKGKN